MRKTITFSVVIPLYNKEKEISRSILSVLNQTNKSFEIIVVDDGSEDKGAAVVNNINDSRIKLIKQKNSGVSVARNRGIKESKGELISFLDADDEWKDNYLETIAHLQKNYSEAGLYATAFQVVSREGVITPSVKGLQKNFKEGLLEDYFRVASLGPGPICASNVTIPRSVLAKVGGFPAEENLGEDLDIWLRIALDYKFALSCKKCVLYHQDASNRLSDNYISGKGLLVVKTAQAALSENLVSSRMVPGLKCYITRCQIFSLRQRISHGGLIELIRYIVESNSRPNKIQLYFYLILALLPTFLIDKIIKRKLHKLEKKSLYGNT